MSNSEYFDKLSTNGRSKFSTNGGNNTVHPEPVEG
jgi:hypothetical protein